jgi:hypothetical protein
MKARTAPWVAGGIAVGSVALMAGGLVLAYLGRRAVPANLTNWDFSDVFAQVVNIALPVGGFVVASRRPANRLGWLALTAGLCLGLGRFGSSYGVYALVAARGSLPAGQAAIWLSNWIWAIPVAMVGFTFLLFPTGQLRTRRWRPAAWFVGGAFGLSTLAVLVGASRNWSHPFAAFSQTVTPPVLAMLLVLFPAALVVSVTAVVVRFARSVGEERLQLKWFAAAAVLVGAAFTGVILTGSAAANVVLNLAFLCLSAAIAIAVLKYRLYDIDRVISRTLAYAIITGLLAVVYAGLVLVTTRVLSFHTPLAVAAATLAVAALFTPLRSRVQRAVDRRFNRARYDADKAIAACAARLQDAVDLDAVRTDLLDAVHQCLEPAHASVWISQHQTIPGMPGTVPAGRHARPAA